MEAPDYDQLRRAYSLYTDAELLHLAGEFDGLTGEAKDALRLEIRQRGLEATATCSEPVQAVTQLPSEMRRSRNSRLNWIWPTITNESEAKKAAKSGAYGALFVALCTGILAIIAIATGNTYAGIDGYGLVDAIVFALIAWGTFKYSFPWAVFGLLLYTAEVFLRLRDDSRQIGFITVIVVLSFVASVRGTYFLSDDKKSKELGVIANDPQDNSVDSPFPSARLSSFRFGAVPAVIICIVLLVTIAYHQERAEEKKTSDLLMARLHDAENESLAIQIQKEFAVLVKDYKAKDWGQFRSELQSREPSLIELRWQNEVVKRRLVARRAGNLDADDICKRLELDEGEPALEAFMAAQEDLMSFTKNTVQLTPAKALALKSLDSHDASARQQWDQYIANMHGRGCDK